MYSYFMRIYLYLFYFPINKKSGIEILLGNWRWQISKPEFSHSYIFFVRSLNNHFQFILIKIIFFLFSFFSIRSWIIIISISIILSSPFFGIFLLWFWIRSIWIIIFNPIIIFFIIVITMMTLFTVSLFRSWSWSSVFFILSAIASFFFILTSSFIFFLISWSWSSFGESVVYILWLLYLNLPILLLINHFFSIFPFFLSSLNMNYSHLRTLFPSFMEFYINYFNIPVFKFFINSKLKYFTIRFQFSAFVQYIHEEDLWWIFCISFLVKMDTIEIIIIY
mgnify:CR=1 FL=1